MRLAGVPEGRSRDWVQKRPYRDRTDQRRPFTYINRHSRHVVRVFWWLGLDLSLRTHEQLLTGSSRSRDDLAQLTIAILRNNMPLSKAVRLLGVPLSSPQGGKPAADIVSRIRDFAKKAPTRTEYLEINEAILEIMGLTRIAISEHGVSVNMRLSEGLPRILADRVQLQQVILNLIMNAIEAMSEVAEGSRDLLIGTRSAQSGTVLVTVSDSGPGLPQANLDRLFEAFFTTKASGLGMGLSICRSIVEAHGGRLWAAPNEPSGAVFCMMLPVRERSLENTELSAP